MLSPWKLGACADVLQHARPSRSKDFWPGPNVLDIQGGTDFGNGFVGLGYELAPLKGEFESQTPGSLSPPHAGAISVQLLSGGAQYMLHQPVGSGFLRQRVQRSSKRLCLAAGELLRCAEGLGRSLAFGDVPQNNCKNQFAAKIEL